MIETLSMIGLIGGLLLLIILTIRGVNVMIAGPLSALFVAIMSGLALFPQLAEPGQADYVASYMQGFSGFIFPGFRSLSSAPSSARSWRIAAPPTAYRTGSSAGWA